MFVFHVKNQKFLTSTNHFTSQEEGREKQNVCMPRIQAIHTSRSYLTCHYRSMYNPALWVIREMTIKVLWVRNRNIYIASSMRLSKPYWNADCNFLGCRVLEIWGVLGTSLWWIYWDLTKVRVGFFGNGVL